MPSEETPLNKAGRQLAMNAGIGNLLLMLGSTCHWIKEAGVSDLFAVGTVLFVPFGILYSLAALWWLVRFTILSWRSA